MYCGKTSDSIEMPFEMVGRVDQRSHVLYGGLISLDMGQIFREMGRRRITIREMWHCGVCSVPAAK